MASYNKYMKLINYITDGEPEEIAFPAYPEGLAEEICTDFDAAYKADKGTIILCQKCLSMRVVGYKEE